MKKYLLATLPLLLVYIIFISHTHAATGPQFFTTWKADTYTPLQYQGKALAIPASRITLSFELVDNGTIVDLSKQLIRWYYKDSLIDQKPGLQTVAVKIPEFVSDDQNFRIEIPSYKGSFISNSINVPLTQPQAVIEWPSLANILVANGLELHGLPYFFNVADPGFLNFSWQVNGKTPLGTQSPDILNLSLGSGATNDTPVNINLTIKNPQSIIEKDESSLQLIYSPKFGQ